MGQPVTVVSKPSSRAGIVRYETNRALTGMGHERYSAGDEVAGTTPADELARRLFARGGIARVHVNGNIVTIQLADVEADADGIGLTPTGAPSAIPHQTRWPWECCRSTYIPPR